MNINFSFDEQTKTCEKIICKIFEIALKETNRPNDITASVVLVTPNEIQELNKTFRNIDKVTDVLSFPLLDDFNDFESARDFTGECEIGDIYINPERASEQAKEYGHSYKREICFLALHGFLHLLGYDHMTEDEEKEMFSLQDIILDKANVGRDFVWNTKADMLV